MAEFDLVRGRGGGRKASDRYAALRHLVTATAFSCSQSTAPVIPLGRLGFEGRHSRPLCRIRQAGKSFASLPVLRVRLAFALRHRHVPVGVRAEPPFLGGLAGR